MGAVICSVLFVKRTFLQRSWYVKFKIYTSCINLRISVKMPPKFRRYLSEEDVTEAAEPEKEKLLQDEEDEDFFLKGPTSSGKTLTIQDKKLRRVQFQVDEVSSIMKDNIEKIMERGERLEDLEEKSDSLATNADQFWSTAKKMQSRMWWRNMRVKVLLVLVVLVILLIIFVPIIVRNS